jgi:hypothetical protein
MVQISSKATSNSHRKNSRKSSLSQLPSTDNVEHASAENQQNEMTQKSSTLTFSLGKFARLKFSDNQEILFNINCQVKNFKNKFPI